MGQDRGDSEGKYVPACIHSNSNRAILLQQLSLFYGVFSELGYFEVCHEAAQTQ